MKQMNFCFIEMRREKNEKHNQNSTKTTLIAKQQTDKSDNGQKQHTTKKNNLIYDISRMNENKIYI